MKKAFADLASPDGQARDEAFVWLMGLNPSDLPALRNLARQSSPLAPEQWMALPQIVMHVYLTGETFDAVPDKGFLGIFLPSPMSEPGDCVIVASCMPGFIGERMLRAGDVILGVLEHPTPQFRKAGDLTEAMAAFKAGDTVRLQVLRGGQILLVAARLDPRPVEAEEGNRTIIDPFNAARRARAEQYWQEQFADLLESPQAQ
jgi:hypothetical protein